jgi:hypothetical protein
MTTYDNVISIVLNTSRKLGINVLNELYWIRDFNECDNEHPFQYERLTYEDLIKVLTELNSTYIRVGLDDGSILYCYYSEEDKKSIEVKQ